MAFSRALAERGHHVVSTLRGESFFHALAERGHYLLNEPFLKMCKKDERVSTGHRSIILSMARVMTVLSILGELVSITFGLTLVTSSAFNAAGALGAIGWLKLGNPNERNRKFATGLLVMMCVSILILTHHTACFLFKPNTRFQSRYVHSKRSRVPDENVEHHPRSRHVLTWNSDARIAELVSAKTHRQAHGNLRSRVRTDAQRQTLRARGPMSKAGIR